MKTANPFCLSPFGSIRKVQRNMWPVCNGTASKRTLKRARTGPIPVVSFADLDPSKVGHGKHCSGGHSICLGSGLHEPMALIVKAPFMLPGDLRARIIDTVAGALRIPRKRLVIAGSGGKLSFFFRTSEAIALQAESFKVGNHATGSYAWLRCGGHLDIRPDWFQMPRSPANVSYTECPVIDDWRKRDALYDPLVWDLAAIIGPAPMPPGPAHTATAV